MGTYQLAGQFRGNKIAVAFTWDVMQSLYFIYYSTTAVVWPLMIPCNQATALWISEFVVRALFIKVSSHCVPSHCHVIQALVVFGRNYSAGNRDDRQGQAVKSIIYQRLIAEGLH